MAKKRFDLTKADSNASLAATANFEELKNFIGNWKKSTARPKREDRYLNSVIEIFKEDVAVKYFERVKILIKPEPPLKRSQKYGEALDHVREHAILLADIARVPPKTVISPERRSLLIGVLQQIAQRLIARRLSGSTQDSNVAIPILLPIFSLRFKYIHFNYMLGFGLVGIPPEFISDNSSGANLSVLWHEAAGHAMAVMKRYNKYRVEEWAEALATGLEGVEHWDAYRDMYRKSILENLRHKEAFEAAGMLDDLKTSYLQKLLTDELIRKETRWQIDWLTEFLEDLFWVMVVEGTESEYQQAAIMVIANALFSRYPDPDVGDVEHPPLRLRLLVAIAYLCLDDPARLEKTINDYSDDIKNLLKPDKVNYTLALTIASFCKNSVISPQSRTGELYQAPSEEEKSLARNILKPDVTVKELESLVQAKNFNVVLEVDRNFLEGSKESIEKIEDLQKLFELKFIDVDLHGGTGSPPPPWRW
jgi:hypothetical protein